MARPDALIAAQRELVADLERKLELARVKLAGYEEMAEALGTGGRRASSGERRSSGRVGGRQPGTITKNWRRVLASLLLRESDWFNAGDVVDVVRSLEDRDIRPSEVRRIFKKYEENGYVQQNENGLYRITDEAVAKFALDKEPQGDGTPNENEAPNGDAAGASEAGGEDEEASEPLDLHSYRLVGQKGG